MSTSKKKTKSKQVHGEKSGDAVDRLRSTILDAIDDMFASGELDELFTAIEPAIMPMGFSRWDILRAVQNTCFPEAFFGNDVEKSGIVPASAKCGGSYSTDAMVQLAQMIAGRGEKSAS